MALKRKKAGKKVAVRSRKSDRTVCNRARRARMSAAINPMLATLVDEPFSNPDWIFETKWDGFRSICFIKRGKARFVSRNQLEMTQQYPELATAVVNGPEAAGDKMRYTFERAIGSKG